MRISDWSSDVCSSDLLLSWPPSGPRYPVAADTEGIDSYTHWRNCGSANSLAARAARRQSKLGLPLLLVARRDLHAAGDSAGGPQTGGRGMGALAQVGGRRLAKRSYAPLTLIME